MEEIEYFIKLKGLSGVKFAKFVGEDLILISFIERLIDSVRKIETVLESLKNLEYTLDKIKTEIQQLMRSGKIRISDSKKIKQNLKIKIDKNTIEKVGNVVEEIYYLRKFRKVENIPVSDTFSIVVYHAGRGGIGKELKPETENGIVVKVLTEGRNVLEFIPYIGGDSRGGLIIQSARDLRKKTIEKLEELLGEIYGAQVVSEKIVESSNKVPSKPKSISNIAVRKCPQCGGNMYHDLEASQPRSFSGEMKPRLICESCKFTIQKK